MDMESQLLEKLDKDKLEQEIENKVESFHGLLNREAALRIIAREHGLISNEEKFYKISEIPKNGKKISVSATVRKIWPTATYNSGKQSRVVEIQDSGGSKPLLLWNEDVGIAKNLRAGDEIMVKGAYERNNELNLGYSGSVEVSKKSGFSQLGALSDSGTVHLREMVSRVGGKAINERGKGMFVFWVSNGEVEKKCVITEGLDRGTKLKAGDEVVIENAIIATKAQTDDQQETVNGNGENQKEMKNENENDQKEMKTKDGNELETAIMINEHSRLLSRRKEGMLLGTITKFECARENPESLVVGIDGREVAVDRENALRLMNLALAQDINLQTIVSIKKDSLLNTKIAVKVEEKNGHLLIR